jgi:ferredoxin
MERPRSIPIEWPDGRRGEVEPGGDWLACARRAGVTIPTGCLSGSCGACEIEVNGRTVRACIATVPCPRSGALTVRLASDPFW